MATGTDARGRISSFVGFFRAFAKIFTFGRSGLSDRGVYVSSISSSLDSS